jgi:hypothetical protein
LIYSRRVAAFALAFILLATTLLPVSAQGDATPVATPAATSEATPAAFTGAPSLDLAAMALNHLDYPDEFNIFYELYIPGDQLSDLLLGGLIPQDEVDATNIIRFYESVYVTPDQTVNLRSYLEEYPDIESALAGYELLEDETRLAPEGANFVDEPGPGIGEEPSEITVGSFEPSVGDADAQFIDITFRVGRVIAGVSTQTASGVAADRELVLQLAERLVERIEAVMAGEPLPEIDTSIPSQTLPIENLGMILNEGYYAASEAFGPEAAAPVEADFESAYLRTIAAGRVTQGESPLPRVSISVVQFGSEESALIMLSDVETWQPAFIGLDRIVLDRIPGASAVLGFQYANPIFAGAENDSVRILMIVESSLVTIDFQGGASIEEARAAASALAVAQADCLQRDDPCTEADLPEGIVEQQPGTPVAPSDPVG